MVKGGSAQYIKSLIKQLDCTWRISSPVNNIQRHNQQITIVTNDNKSHTFDAVILATHSDQALNLLETPSEQEREILKRISYEKNHVIVHTDESIMHPNKQSWASWNTQVPYDLDQTTLRCCTATYWMNLLQGLPIKTNVFSTLNSSHRIDPKKILKERTYEHPIFTADSVAAQKQKALINGQQNTYYVGAYWGWGFHEDGARSAYETAELIKTQL